MSKGKKVVKDFIPAGTPEPRGDSSDENLSATDMGMDFSQNVPTVAADPNEQ